MDIDDDVRECPICGCELPDQLGMFESDKFCPDCGYDLFEPSLEEINNEDEE